MAGKVGSFDSPWPVRGGPAVLDGKVYFATGIWPFMGVSIRALDAAMANLGGFKSSCTFQLNHPQSAGEFAAHNEI